MKANTLAKILVLALVACSDDESSTNDPAIPEQPGTDDPAGEVTPLAEGEEEEVPPTEEPPVEEQPVEEQDEPQVEPPVTHPTVDVVSVDLTLDVSTYTGRATLELALTGTEPTAVLNVGDLAISSVTDDTGASLEHVVEDGSLVLTTPSTSPTTQVVVIDYAWAAHDAFDGWASTGATFTWPYFCGNLFPCEPDPADGARYTIALSGIVPDTVVVYPASIDVDAPAYMPAIAMGSYTELALEPTTAGTEVSVWYLTGGEMDALTGTAHLSQVVDTYERIYGAYPFGTKVGSVSADWGGGDYGGMEHHPFWHVSSGSMAGEYVHAHEAAHGWFGNGVRIACWEDFVLSEGTASYMATKVLSDLGVDQWAKTREVVAEMCAADWNAQALPDTCGEIDIYSHPIWSGVPYYKGTMFYKEVADLVGADVLDGVLGSFFGGIL